MAYELRPVRTSDEWQALHEIRRATLFAPGRHGDAVAYNDAHPDDHNPAHQPFLLMLDGTPSGVVRLDPRGVAAGVVRLVAIVPALQRRGHGRAMSDLVDAEARRRSMRRLFVNAHESAVGFYECTGWRTETWDESELVGIASECVQMAKNL